MHRFSWIRHARFVRGRLRVLHELGVLDVTSVSGTRNALTPHLMERQPRVELVGIPSRPTRVYFTDADDIVWRIYDRSFGPPHAEHYNYHTFRSVGDPRATYRWFSATGSVAALSDQVCPIYQRSTVRISAASLHQYSTHLQDRG